jgi:hypothetical protein
MLGRYPALSLKLARAERDKRETLVAQGQSPAVQKRLAKQGAAPDTTVAEFGERFFRDVVAKDRRDLTIPRRYFDKSIVPAIGAKARRTACASRSDGSSAPTASSLHGASR